MENRGRCPARAAPWRMSPSQKDRWSVAARHLQLDIFSSADSDGGLGDDVTSHPSEASYNPTAPSTMSSSHLIKGKTVAHLLLSILNVHPLPFLPTSYAYRYSMMASHLGSAPTTHMHMGVFSKSNQGLTESPLRQILGMGSVEKQHGCAREGLPTPPILNIRHRISPPRTAIDLHDHKKE